MHSFQEYSFSYEAVQERQRLVESMRRSIVVDLTGGIERIHTVIRQKQLHESGPSSSLFSPVTWERMSTEGGRKETNRHFPITCGNEESAVEEKRSEEGQAMCLRLWESVPLMQRRIILHHRYAFEEVIQRGSTSEVICAVDLCRSSAKQPSNSKDLSFSSSSNLSSPRVAIKIVDPAFTRIGIQEARIFRERLSLGSCPNMNLLERTFWFEGRFCLVFPLLGPSLWELLYRFPTSDTTSIQSLPFIRSLCIAVLSALLSLKSYPIIHGDIRPENILLSVRADGAKLIPQSLDDVHFTDFKVVDLGSAFPTEVSSLYHDEFEVQSLAYRAPEVLFGCEFDEKIDIWSLACTAIELRTRKRVFRNTTRKEMLEDLKILFGNVDKWECFSKGKFYHSSSGLIEQSSLAFLPSDSSSLWNRVRELVASNDPYFVDFLLRTLNPDPKQRMSAEEALCHPFLSSNVFPFNYLMGSEQEGLNRRFPIAVSKQIVAPKSSVHIPEVTLSGLRSTVHVLSHTPSFDSSLSSSKFSLNQPILNRFQSKRLNKSPVRSSISILGHSNESKLGKEEAVTSDDDELDRIYHSPGSVDISSNPSVSSSTLSPMRKKSFSKSILRPSSLLQTFSNRSSSSISSSSPPLLLHGRTVQALKRDIPSIGKISSGVDLSAPFSEIQSFEHHAYSDDESEDELLCVEKRTPSHIQSTDSVKKVPSQRKNVQKHRSKASPPLKRPHYLGADIQSDSYNFRRNDLVQQVPRTPRHRVHVLVQLEDDDEQG